MGFSLLLCGSNTHKRFDVQLISWTSGSVVIDKSLPYHKVVHVYNRGINNFKLPLIDQNSIDMAQLLQIVIIYSYNIVTIYDLTSYQNLKQLNPILPGGDVRHHPWGFLPITQRVRKINQPNLMTFPENIYEFVKR